MHSVTGWAVVVGVVLSGVASAQTPSGSGGGAHARVFRDVYVASKALDGATQAGVNKLRYGALVGELATALLLAKDSVKTPRQQLVWTAFDDVLAVHELALGWWAASGRPERVWATQPSYAATAYTLYQSDRIPAEARRTAGAARRGTIEQQQTGYAALRVRSARPPSLANRLMVGDSWDVAVGKRPALATTTGTWRPDEHLWIYEIEGTRYTFRGTGGSSVLIAIK